MYYQLPMATAYIKSSLHNGVGRYVCQLQRLTLKFCKGHKGSNGLREFIEQDLLDFVRSNPGVVVYLKPRIIGTAGIDIEYLNGQTDYICVSKKSRKDISSWIEYHRTRSGYPIVKFLKNHHTDVPSIQGVWTPFLNKPSWLNVASFPDERKTGVKTFFPTATEQLLKLAKDFGLEDQEVTEKEKQASSS